MKRIILGACAAAVVMLAPALAIAQTHEAHADSPKASLTIDQPLAVGSTVIATGEYKFQCRHLGDKDMLVVTDAVTGKEVARVPCKRQELDSKTKQSQFNISSASGKRTLLSLKIKGESVEHIVITD